MKTGIFVIKKQQGPCPAMIVSTIYNRKTGETLTEYPDGKIILATKKNIKRLDKKSREKYNSVIAFFEKAIKKTPRNLEIKQVA